MGYRLNYFPIRGRGEQIRLLLHALEIDFEDVRIGREEFMKLKALGPGTLAFGALPMLEDGDLRLVQGPAIMGYLARRHGAVPDDPQGAARADAITLGAEDLRIKYFGLFGDGADEKREKFLNGDWRSRWLPALDGLLEANDSDRHFVGAALTHADVAVWDVLSAMVGFVDGACLNDAPRLAGFYASFAERPSVARYLASRPND